MEWGTLAFQTYLCLVGGELFLAGLQTLRTRLRLWRIGIRVQGSVLGWTANYDTDGTIDGYSPRVGYTARDGSQHELAGQVAGVMRRTPGPTGQAFPIIYDPVAPGRALAGHAPWFWLAPPILLTFGAFVVWAALVRLPA